MLVELDRLIHRIPKHRCHASLSSTLQVSSMKETSKRWLATTPSPDLQSPEIVPSKMASEQGSWNERLDFFQFTRGRFVVDEAHEMRRRFVKFDMDKLTRIAANAVGAQTCIKVEKCPDGLYNKAFVMTMDTGVEIIAKVPNPNAGSPHLVVASEVATMEFARTVLRIPTPAVFDYNATSQTVGAPYIIMEKVKGISLEEVWPSMPFEQRWKLVQSLLAYQKILTGMSFKRYGSLFFNIDLNESQSTEWLYEGPNGEKIVDTRFAVGASTGREWYDDGRHSVEFDRGPCNTPEQYATAYAYREITCSKELHTLPPSPISLFGPGVYIPSRTQKVRAAESVLKIIPYLLPRDRALSASKMWHDDLHAGNIFVDRDDPTTIVSIIDWQSVELAPLFQHSHKPALISVNGPEPEKLGKPDFPAGYDDPDPVVSRAAKRLWVEQCIFAASELWVKRHNQLLWRASEFQSTDAGTIMVVARNLLVDGEAIILSKLLELRRTWSETSGVSESCPSFPLEFTHEEEERIASETLGSIHAMSLMRNIQDKMGSLYPEKFLVEHGNYDLTKRLLNQARAKVVEMYAEDDEARELWERLWPFDR